MATKSILFLLPLMLTLTRMVSSMNDINGPPEMEEHVIAVSAPVHAPMKAPIPAPVHAPTHSPSVAPTHAPAISPTKPPVRTTDCRVLCKGYCLRIRPYVSFRTCMRSCNPCCKMLNCVPKTMTCPKWNRIRVLIHGVQAKCPSRTMT